MTIRKYEIADFNAIAKLFYDTVHAVNIRDYSDLQVNAWADGSLNFEKWNGSLLENYAVVACVGDLIVGFGDIDSNSHIDRLYVHKDFQRQGIATSICDELENRASKAVSVHASITAKPFFENRGYRVLKEQQVECKNVPMTNFVMEKIISK